MAQSPYTLLTVSSSSFSGSATGIIDLGGLYRTVQAVSYLSTDAAATTGTGLFLTVDKREEPGIYQYAAESGIFEGRLIYDGPLVYRAIYGAPGAATYYTSKDGFYRYVKATLTGESSNFSAGTVKVVISFDGPQTP